jgi:GNAT superfamily N-acetyltransferase
LNDYKAMYIASIMITAENLAIEQVRPELIRRMRRDVLYPGEPLQVVEIDTDADALHFGAFYNNQLVSVVSLFEDGTDYQFRKFAVAVEMQGKGIGTLVLQYITDFARLQGGTRLWCNARVAAINFYLRAGFVATGKKFTKGGLDYEIIEMWLPPTPEVPPSAEYTF